MILIFSLVAFMICWALTLDFGALGEFLLLLCVGWLVIQLTCKCKKENRIDAQRIYTILMLCYGSYAFFCHAYRVYNHFEAIGSMDGPGYYLPCTLELLDSQSLGELIFRINDNIRYDGGGSIFVYFVPIAKLARDLFDVDIHLAIQLSLMPFAALIGVVEYHLLKRFDIPSREAYRWSIGFGLGSALFWMSSFIVRDLPIVLAYFLITYLMFSPAPRWQRVLWLGGIGTYIAASIRLSSGLGMVPLLMLAVFCDPDTKSVKHWQLISCVIAIIALGALHIFLEEIENITTSYMEIELQDQNGQSLLSSFNALPFGISHFANTVYAQFHPIPAWRYMFTSGAPGARDYVYNITKFPDLWVVFFRITGLLVLFYGCLKSEIRRKVFENKPLLYGFIYILIWMMLQASTIEERRKLGGYAILFTVAVLFWRQMPRVSRIRVVLLSLAIFVGLQLVSVLRTVF